MSDPLPDSAEFYTSVHSNDVLIAIGHFITTWASVEMAIPMQVARLIASGTNPDTGARTYSATAYMKAAAALIGTPAKASLTQLENLAWGRGDDIKKCADKIIGIKPKRDAVAHSLAAPEGGTTRFHGFGASRIRMGTDKIYSVKEMNSWASILATQSREIDGIVTEMTGITWKQTAEECERAFQAVDQRQLQSKDSLPHGNSGP